MAVQPSPAVVAKQIKKRLRALADPQSAAQAQNYFKTAVPLLGVGAADVRAVAAAQHKEVRSRWSAADAVALCDFLLPAKPLEIKITGLLVLARFGRQLDGDVLAASARWLMADLCNGWSVVDALCADVLGPLLQRRPELVRGLALWFKSPNLWMRRAAMVALVKPARRGMLLDDVYARACMLLNDPEDLVQKAVGWLLREAGKTDMPRLQSFLEQNGAASARTTLRYALERFPPKVRQRLLQATRS